MIDALTRFVAGQDRARLRAADRGPRRSASSRRSKRCRATTRRSRSMLDSIHDRAGAVADVGGARLARHPAARARAIARAASARAAGAADPALAPELPGNDDGLLHRAHRRAVVADDLRRLECESHAAVECSTSRNGARTCRGSCAARSAGSSADTGTRRSRTPGACSRWRSSLRRSSRRRSPARRRISYGASDEVTWPRERPMSSQVDLPWQEARASLDISHEGTGEPWVMIRATAALPLDEAAVVGYKITRSVTPVEQQDAGPLDARRRRARATRDRSAVGHDAGSWWRIRFPAARRSWAADSAASRRC